MNASAVLVHRPTRDISTSHFVRHFLEMVVAMIVGMAVLGALVSLIFRLLGHANLLHFAGLRALLMTTYMIVGMSLWMRHRGHNWTRITEMSAAMALPLALLIGPFWAGLIFPRTLLVAMHALMLPFMLVAMLLRRNEYAQDHRHHAHQAPPARHNVHQGSSEPRSAPFPRSFAKFNRKVANPVMRKIAGSFGPFAIVRHRGRRTGRDYATPVLAFGTEDGLLVGVLYGTSSDWVRNVLAGDRAEVKWHGQSHAYDQPRLISSEEALPTVAAVIRGPFRLLGVRNFVRFTASSLEDALN
ncbi:MAG TPA: nitroreductase/quinone reductase family protein [Propionibacteriaceae bacterium]|jgi:deazaflavin-dependent oxidoreductase (nitroreductase family)|nr:nitroreductase/quinone reductase family protein [Propionibacteriaceae bacterium]